MNPALRTPKLIPLQVLRYLCLLPLVLFDSGYAQSTVPPEAFGSVSGHVFCADTDAPARFARVTFEPARDFDDAPDDDSPNKRRASTNIVKTSLDGSFAAAKLAAGRYVVLAELPGYLTPISEILPGDTGSLENENRRLMRGKLAEVTVAPDETAHIELRLKRGAALTGTVRFEDGNPVVAADVNVLRKQKDGSWKPFSNGMNGRFGDRQITDDQGHFRIAGLPAAEYLVVAQLQAVTMSTEGSYLGYAVEPPGIGQLLQVYNGSATRRRDARAIPLVEGEERSLADIVVPVSKLYALSGTVVARQDGHALNYGTMTLTDGADPSAAKKAYVHVDGRFEFVFVPDGDYTLKVTASDSVAETSHPPDHPEFTSTRWKATHSYADLEQPLSVSGDRSGIVLSMPEKPTEDKPAAAAEP